MRAAKGPIVFVRKHRQCKDVGYWRSLGIELKAYRGKVILDHEGKPVLNRRGQPKRSPMVSPRGEYRARRNKMARIIGASVGVKGTSHRKRVQAGKNYRRMMRLIAQREGEAK